MSDPGTPTGFAAAAQQSLALRGINGPDIRVDADPAGLVVRNADGARLAIPVARVERVRLAVVSFAVNTNTLAHFYQAQVTLAGESAPLVLRARTPQAEGYRSTMHAFAAAMVEAHGFESVEIGESTGRKISAITGIALALIITLCLLLAAMLWSANRAGAIFFLVAALIVTGGAIAILAVANFGAPRSIQSLAELERVLPDPVRPN